LRGVNKIKAGTIDFRWAKPYKSIFIQPETMITWVMGENGVYNFNRIKVFNLPKKIKDYPHIAIKRWDRKMFNK